MQPVWAILTIAATQRHINKQGAGIGSITHLTLIIGSSRAWAASFNILTGAQSRP